MGSLRLFRFIESQDGHWFHNMPSLFGGPILAL
jgi:hypothetical protein